MLIAIEYYILLLGRHATRLWNMIFSCMGRQASSYGVLYFGSWADMLLAMEYHILVHGLMWLWNIIFCCMGRHATSYRIFYFIAWADMLLAIEYYILLHGPTCY